jgi:hypothetical protein
VDGIAGHGRRLYGVQGLVPGAALMSGGTIGGLGTGGDKEGRAFYQRLIMDGKSAANTFMKTGDFRPLRRYALLYVNRFGGGLQAEKIIETIEAYSHGGQHLSTPDKYGNQKALFTMEEDELLQSIFFGPYETRSGRAYLAKLRGEKTP